MVLVTQRFAVMFWKSIVKFCENLKYPGGHSLKHELVTGSPNKSLEQYFSQDIVRSLANYEFVIPQNRFSSFLSAFLGVLIFYSSLIFFISNANNHILAQKISLLVLKNDNEIMIIALSAMISALVAGISALSGRSIAIVVKKS